jgi:hypothetical protein
MFMIWMVDGEHAINVLEPHSAYLFIGSRW